MKKTILLLLTICLFKYVNAQDDGHEVLSIQGGVGSSIFGLKGISDKPTASYSILFHLGKNGGCVLGAGMDFGAVYKYKVDSVSRYIGTNIVEIIIGGAIPWKWSNNISGPAIFARFGVGIKSEGDPYPAAPIVLALSLQQNGNITYIAESNFAIGLFARGTLGSVIYKDLGSEPVKNLKHNPYGLVEAGVRVFLVKDD